MIWRGLILLVAAALEVGGDAVIREGLARRRAVLVVTGGLVLWAYGVVVNTTTLDFSRLMGTYVAVFAILGVVVGRVFFHETIAGSTWAGVGLIAAGGLLIQWGRPT